MFFCVCMAGGCGGQKEGGGDAFFFYLQVIMMQMMTSYLFYCFRRGILVGNLGGGARKNVFNMGGG